MRARIWLACLALAAVAGCSDDDQNDPPQIIIVAPDQGDHLTAAANVVADATDDEAVVKVRFTVGDTVLPDDFAAPWQAAIPVGPWASGEPVVLGATAWDSDGVPRSAPPVTITIDPALQTVPQLLALEPGASGDPPPLEARWLRFPEATGYTLQLSRGEGFGAILLEQIVADTVFVTDVASEGVVYARVRAATLAGASAWSRVRRFAEVPSLLTVVRLPASQAGGEVAVRPDGALAVVSGPRAGLSIGTVAPELISLDESGVVTGRPALPAFAAVWLADPSLYLCGEDWVACHGMDDGAQVWRVQPTSVAPTAVGPADDETSLWVAGRDLLEDATPSIALVNLARADGAELARVTVDLEADFSVTQVLGLAGITIVAGDIPGGGVWVRGVDPAQDQVLWRLQVGTGNEFRLRDAVVAGDDAVLVGQATRGGAWAAAIAADGRLRWLTREPYWAELSGAAPAYDGGVLVTGFARAEGGAEEFVCGELTDAGGWRWQQRRAYTLGARGLGVTAGADGSVLVVGTALPEGGDWDLLLQRTDDRGDLD